jgi:hypothetical protein
MTLTPVWPTAIAIFTRLVTNRHTKVGLILVIFVPFPTGAFIWRCAVSISAPWTTNRDTIINFPLIPNVAVTVSWRSAISILAVITNRHTLPFFVLFVLFVAFTGLWGHTLAIFAPLRTHRRTLVVLQIVPFVAATRTRRHTLTIDTIVTEWDTIVVGVLVVPLQTLTNVWLQADAIVTAPRTDWRADKLIFVVRVGVSFVTRTLVRCATIGILTLGVTHWFTHAVFFLVTFVTLARFRCNTITIFTERTHRIALEAIFWVFFVPCVTFADVGVNALAVDTLLPAFRFTGAGRISRFEAKQT